MKDKRLSKTIKITLVVLLVMLIILSILIGTRIMEEESNTPIYSTIESMPNIETMINQMYGKFIKMEDSKDEKYIKDIYVDLKYGLYENEVAKKDFFNSLISNVAQMSNYQNVRVIDEERQIELKIICDNTNGELIGSYINGDINFYGHFESQKALSNYKETEITNLNIESIELKTLIENDWNKNKLSIGEAANQVDEYIPYPDFGIDIYEIDEKVFNLIFDSRYEGTVVNGIRVGENLENVINKLGTPTFGSKETEYIGYKGENLYIFFNGNEISVYPTETSDSNLSELIKQYETDGSIKNMVSSATDIWENYEEYYYDEYTVDLTYPLQGIKFQFGISENHGIIIYSNYAGKIFDNYSQKELSELEVEIPSYIYFVQEDSVNEYERERNNLIKATGENGDFEEEEWWKYI